MTIPLDVLLRDSAYKLDQFKPAHINALQASITIKDAAKKPAPYVTCLVRGKPIKLTADKGDIFNALLEIIYKVRCLLVHGDMEPSKENHEVVKQCYGLLHLMMRF